jgi:hypothetical protein
VNSRCATDRKDKTDRPPRRHAALPKKLCVRIAAERPDFVNLPHKISCRWQVVEGMI